ncbi:putative carbonic anhydrase 3 isoform X2 [Orussus abietinus]|uniref:putative carbonic anhydrase 3 isoform X2 n=1 Tax=Orussus abietinus TaxID=222816 RepID=UPI0006254484|nr:putative carbonic anhydrase 3 isoform X2 [Orussus abietinus]
MRFALVLASVYFLTSGVNASGGGHWSYWGENGPADWPGLCAKGEKQSPINIIPDDTIKSDIGPLKFIRYDFAYYGKVVNTGHSVQITLNSIPILLMGGGLKSTYVLEQMHLHWGAEHTVDGTRDAMELHLVHYDKKYDNVSAAAEHDKGLAVVAVLFEQGPEDHGNLTTILKAAESTSNAIGVPVKTQTKIVPLLLLPKDHTTYYRYDGSLTTPGCQESVVWFVLTEKQSVSDFQLKVLRNLQVNNDTLSHNFRPAQKLGSRKVYLHLDGYSTASSSNPRIKLALTMVLVSRYLFNIA